MRTHRRPIVATATVIATAGLVALLVLLALAAAVPVLAKEGLEARLDAPIARDTPGGTTLLVGMTVMAPDENGDLSHPVEGSPIYLKLTGPDGSSTRERGHEDRTLGHYTMRIAVPAGGVGDIEVGIHGTSDLPISVMDTPLVAGGITAATAQVAPALVPAMTPLARASAPAPEHVAVTPIGAPTTAPAPAPMPVGAIVAAVAMLAAGAVLLVLAAARRARGAGRLAAPPRAPGA